MKLQTDPICPPIHCSSSTQEMSIIRHQLDQAVIYTLSSTGTDMHSFMQTHTWFTALKQVGLSFSLLSLLPVVWASSKSREKRLRLSLSLSIPESLIFLVSSWLSSALPLRWSSRGKEQPLVGPKKTSSLLSPSHHCINRVGPPPPRPLSPAVSTALAACWKVQKGLLPERQFNKNTIGSGE